MVDSGSGLGDASRLQAALILKNALDAIWRPAREFPTFPNPLPKLLVILSLMGAVGVGS